MQLWLDELYMCFLVVRLATSIPLAPQFGTPIPPLPFPADEDISSCQLTPTFKSPTQPWHDASFGPIDDSDNLGATLANQSLPLPLSSYQPLAQGSVAVTRKRDDQSTDTTNITAASSGSSDNNNPLPPSICTTIAAFTYTNLPIKMPQADHQIRPLLTLTPGTYVLSFTNNYRVAQIVVQSKVGGHMTTTVHPFDLVVSGTVAFQVFQTAEAWFSFGWGLREPGDGLSSGEVALFRIGPG